MDRVNGFNPNNEILCVRFNQDGGCFACGTANGFFIFNADPVREKQRIDWRRGGIGKIEMLFRCSHMALIGGGSVPKYPRNKLVIWDGMKQTEQFEMEFASEVKNVRLRKDRIIVVLESVIKIYSFDLNPMEQERLETCYNPTGIAAVCAAENSPVIAFPGRKAGQVGLAVLGSGMPPEYIAAHDNPIACLALNQSGELLATASTKGTLVRIYSTHFKTQVEECRRGTTPATIYCLAFNQPSTLLCASSNRDTIHVFSLDPSSAPTKPRSGSISKILNPKTSFAKIEVKSGLPVYCAFSAVDNRSLLAVSLSGDYHRFEVQDSGKWNRTTSDNLLNPRDPLTSFQGIS